MWERPVPEGDTIHKVANFLGPALAGERIVDLELSRRFSRPATAGWGVGRRIDEVVARGKHLYVVLDDDTALRSHLGMYGSWHFYPSGAPWQRPRSQASLVLKTEDRVYVCFNARDVEWVKRPSVRGRVLAQRLGPDLTTGRVEAVSVVERARAFREPDAPLIDVLLDQRIACGIGNVYKSELMFIRRHPPKATLGQISDAELVACYALAGELLASNLGGGKRVTRRENDGAGRLWVYGRGGSPCLRCGAAIRYARLGEHHRGTYWCPDCQGPG